MTEHRKFQLFFGRNSEFFARKIDISADTKCCGSEDETWGLFVVFAQRLMGEKKKEEKAPPPKKRRNLEIRCMRPLVRARENAAERLATATAASAGTTAATTAGSRRNRGGSTGTGVTVKAETAGGRGRIAFTADASACAATRITAGLPDKVRERDAAPHP